MILNEDYFDDLEINDEDIVTDDVEEPEQKHEHELTLEKVKKIPEQYSHCIRIDIVYKIDEDTTFIQTSLLPRIFKRLDIILESHCIEHSEYILTMIYDVKMCETVIKFGDYQLFCLESNKDEFINDTYKYKHFQIQVYLNYPKFNYKRAFRFLYTMLNLYRIYEQINWMDFEPIATNDYVIELTF